MVRNKGYKTYQTGHWSRNNQTNIVLCNASLHQLPKTTEIVTGCESRLWMCTVRIFCWV